jgi:hypothetical protein
MLTYNMGGGLMQLVAYGAQDIYLTGNPQITFFKVVYRRHTNFSMEAIEQVFSGTADFGNNVTATISRNGDLVHRMYLEHGATFSGDNVGLVERYGDSLIKECEIEIGGQRIDKHTSMWNRVYSDLTEYNPSGHFGNSVPPGTTGLSSAGSGTLYQLMTGNGYSLTSAGDAGGADDGTAMGVTTGDVINGFTYTDGTSIVVGRIFLPLNFWFNRNPGLALPLIALQYHEVKVKMTFETVLELCRNIEPAQANGLLLAAVTSSQATLKTFKLWCDYIYLDTDERRRFAQVSHEYLIEQLQISEKSVTSPAASIKLNFNHPVKELIWCAQNTGTQGRHGPGGQSDGDGDGTTKLDSTAGPASLDEVGGNWQLKLNGHDRFAERDSKYFTRTQVWQHHTGYGAVPTTGLDFGTATGARTEYYDLSKVCGADSIAVYSFALKPEEHQPSGTCNFSRIDNAQLVGSSLTIEDIEDTALNPLTTATEVMKLTIFAVNYNVLRIMSGMGGLAYSN